MKYQVMINGKLKTVGKHFHFTDATTSSQDRSAGAEMAHEIGDTYITLEMSPVEQWTEIMKALRVHGFRISFEETDERTNTLR